ncbi:MAG: hypothetical protein JXR25_00145 [Pontiellaceae bacterium]|nr:hypothetical protein [Pontiellaceae bacterium]MBN2783209.1 hypothetical protein [Pontiellaceae bacterium]
MAGKVKKAFGIVTGLLLILLLILVCIFFLWLGPTVKLAVEHVGSKALGTALKIEVLEINPRRGTFHMEGFSIANHDAFGRTNAVSVKELDIAFDAGSVFSDTVLVHRIWIDSPAFVYEQNEATDNIARFILSIEAYLGAEKKPLKTEPEQPEKAAPSKAVWIESMEISQAQMYLANTHNPDLDIDAGLESLTLSMTNGLVTLRNLHISNPAGLELPNLFTLDRIEVLIEPESLYSDTLSILDVKISNPYAYLEHNETTDTLSEIMKLADNIVERAGSAEAPSDEMPATADENETARPPVALHNLTIDDIQLRLLDSASDRAKTETLLAGIASINVRLIDGTISVKALSVPNPEGFSTNNLFQVAQIDVILQPDTLYGGQLQIDRIAIDAPLINLEQTEESGNAVALQNKLAAFIPSAQTAPAEPVEEDQGFPDETAAPIPLSEQPVILNELVVSNFAINLKEPVSTNEPIWSISLTDLNPLNMLSLEKLNIFSSSEEEEAETAPDAPVQILGFQNLTILPMQGMIDINNLELANPPDFTRRKLMRLESLHCELDPESVQTETILIHDLTITRPKVRYERQILIDNIKALQKAIEQAAVAKTESEPDNGGKEPETTESGKNVIIDRVLITKSSVQAKLSIAPATPPIPLPGIELKDIGKEKGGTTPIEASTKVIDTFYDTMISAVGETTGFAADVLKGAGGLVMPLQTDEESAKEETSSTETAPAQQKEKEEPTRARFKSRHPGRIF